MPRPFGLVTTTLFLLTALAPAQPVSALSVASPVFALLKDDGDKSDTPPAKDAGSIDGQVTSVDYGAGKITVKAGSTRYDVIVLPSTSIVGKATGTFHTIADIHKGAHVQVIMSRRADAYTAQIIRLL